MPFARFTPLNARVPGSGAAVITARNVGILRAGPCGLIGLSSFGPRQPRRETVPSLVPAQPAFEKVGRKR
jgi:hypothetical protein